MPCYLQWENMAIYFRLRNLILIVINFAAFHCEMYALPLIYVTALPLVANIIEKLFSLYFSKPTRSSIQMWNVIPLQFGISLHCDVECHSIPADEIQESSILEKVLSVDWSIRSRRRCPDTESLKRFYIRRHLEQSLTIVGMYTLNGESGLWYNHHHFVKHEVPWKHEIDPNDDACSIFCLKNSFEHT